MEDLRAAAASSRTHIGSVRLLNDWGIELASVTVRHRRRNKPELQEEKTWDSVAPGSEADGPLAITYEASHFHHDYWWVKLVGHDGEIYTCKDDFWCSLTSEDDGHVELTLDGASKKLRVRFSHSRGDSTEMHHLRT